MKTKLFFTFGLLLAICANAQTNLYSTNRALPDNPIIEENSLQSTFAALDKSKIETGLLLDAAVEFAKGGAKYRIENLGRFTCFCFPVLLF